MFNHKKRPRKRSFFICIVKCLIAKNFFTGFYMYMKINPVNIFNFNSPQYNKKRNSVKNIQNQQFDYSMAEAFSQHSNKYSKNSFALDEALGRSQVNFTGRNDEKFQEYDKMFIDTVSQNLRLSDEDKRKLSDNIQSFLKINKFKSLEDIRCDENKELQMDCLAELGAEICRSDYDCDIFTDAFYDRIHYNDQYVPEVDLYEKDYEIVDQILDKYDMNDSRKFEIFDVLKMHADSSGVETVFDLFKPENEPTVLMGLINDQLRLNKDLSTDLLIDFALMAKKDAKARREGINPWKMSDLMDEQEKDKAIADEIMRKYNIENEEPYADSLDYSESDDMEDDDFAYDEEAKDTMEEITDQLDRRRYGISIEQISYELAEKYDLPSGAYEFIKNTINRHDAED